MPRQLSTAGAKVVGRRQGRLSPSIVAEKAPARVHGLCLAHGFEVHNFSLSWPYPQQGNLHKFARCALASHLEVSSTAGARSDLPTATSDHGRRTKPARTGTRNSAGCYGPMEQNQTCGYTFENMILYCFQLT